jgi:hypothetical protein
MIFYVLKKKTKVTKLGIHKNNSVLPEPFIFVEIQFASSGSASRNFLGNQGLVSAMGERGGAHNR